MTDDTLSDQFARVAPRRADAEHTALFVVFRASDPDAAPSRHLLDDVDVIAFGRGEPAAVRRDLDGRRGLELRLPDAVMSSDHGRLIRTERGWQLDDPRSRNGAFVDGRPTRFAVIADGSVIQLGHTLMLVARSRVSATAEPDTVLVPPPSVLASFATFDPRFAAGIAELPRIAPSDVTILVSGETGSGKEVVARAIHTLSGRRGELVAVNCGGIPPTLIESELFGHRKGAFSGALADRLGHVRTADHGTLFLDEIGELPMQAQTVLLRVLQQREVVPVGDSLPIRVDVRLIAATHRDLPALVAQGAFRDDLYARLLGITLTLPPIRTRRFDLGLLVGALLRRIDPGGALRVTPAAMTAILRYDWPRNVRELERALVAGHVRSDGAPIDLAHLPDDLTATEPASPPQVPPPSTAEDETLRAELVAALTRHAGNVTSAAKELGRHREQIHRWARRLGIDLDSFRR